MLHGIGTDGTIDRILHRNVAAQPDGQNHHDQLGQIGYTRLGHTCGGNTSHRHAHHQCRKRPRPKTQPGAMPFFQWQGKQQTGGQHFQNIIALLQTI